MKEVTERDMPIGLAVNTIRTITDTIYKYFTMFYNYSLNIRQPVKVDVNHY